MFLKSSLLGAYFPLSGFIEEADVELNSFRNSQHLQVTRWTIDSEAMRINTT